MFLRWHGGLLWLACLIRFEQLRYNYNDNILYSTSMSVHLSYDSLLRNSDMPGGATALTAQVHDLDDDSDLDAT